MLPRGATPIDISHIQPKNIYEDEPEFDWATMGNKRRGIWDSRGHRYIQNADGTLLPHPAEPDAPWPPKFDANGIPKVTDPVVSPHDPTRGSPGARPLDEMGVDNTTLARGRPGTPIYEDDPAGRWDSQTMGNGMRGQPVGSPAVDPSSMNPMEALIKSLMARMGSRGRR